MRMILIKNIDTILETQFSQRSRHNSTNSKSVELRFMSVRVKIGVPFNYYGIVFANPQNDQRF